jgi:leader peptidase (prepilin peptidase) / N-methyltransferase
MIDFSALPREFIAISAFAFGLAIGSFLNVVIHRLPRGESLLRPGSRCPACAAALSATDNVPLLSFLCLRGRCRRCSAKISLRYPAVELLTALIFAAIAWRHGADPMTPIWCGFAAALIAVSVIDIDHQIIPDEISIGGLVVALLAVPAVASLSGTSWIEASIHSALGAAVGGGVLWSVGFAHARLSVAIGRRFEHWPGPGEEIPKASSLDYWVWFPGVGFGDVKLLAMIGAVLGPLGVMETILAASLIGLVVGVGWALATRKWNAPFGFGPAIAAGALLVVLLPDRLFFSY